MIRTRSRIRNLIDEIEALSQLSIFENTRRRETVEIRSLFYTILRKFYRFNLREIMEIGEEYGYYITHASVIHSLKSFEVYKTYNKNLEQWFHAIIVDLEDDVAMTRIEFIKPKLKYLSEQNLLKLSTTVKEMYEESLIQMREESLQT
mgnify:CR=1 FL=1|jgi:hypothetical protein|tara:strand:+ start:586 stop:1029 length:444 start_codon:yes stop_codon:yes gene_type:complete